MKLRYKGEFNLSSVTKSFKGKDQETVYEVTDTDGKYLLNTFKELFEEIKETKTVEKPKEETKPKTTKTRTTKTTKSTKAKETETK